MKDHDGAQDPGWRDDHREEMRLNSAISKVLVVGLTAAVALLVVGAILALVRPGGTPGDATSLGGMVDQLAAGEAGGFLQLGLVVLLLTPFARVLALGIAFATRRQWLFTGISVLVAGLLVIGAVLGVTLG